jgi:hypothetical protein
MTSIAEAIDLRLRDLADVKVSAVIRWKWFREHVTSARALMRNAQPRR